MVKWTCIVMATPIRPSNLVTREWFAGGKGTKRKGQAGSPVGFKRQEQQCVTEKAQVSCWNCFPQRHPLTSWASTTNVRNLQVASSHLLFPVLLAQFNFHCSLSEGYKKVDCQCHFILNHSSPAMAEPGSALSEGWSWTSPLLQLA